MVKENKSVPVRRCVGCSQRIPKEELIRVVRLPDGEIVIDHLGKEPGRGAYLCRCSECLKKALKKRRLEQNLRSKIPDAVIESLKEGLQLNE